MIEVLTPNPERTIVSSNQYLACIFILSFIIGMPLCLLGITYLIPRHVFANALANQMLGLLFSAAIGSAVGWVVTRTLMRYIPPPDEESDNQL